MYALSCQSESGSGPPVLVVSNDIPASGDGGARNRIKRGDRIAKVIDGVWIEACTTAYTISTKERRIPVPKIIAEFVYVLLRRWPEAVPRQRMMQDLYGGKGKPPKIGSKAVRQHASTARKFLDRLGFSVLALEQTYAETGCPYKIVRMSRAEAAKASAEAGKVVAKVRASVVHNRIPKPTIKPDGGGA